MNKASTRPFLSSVFKKNSLSFLSENKKMIAQFAFTLFFVALGIWFIKHESAELTEVKKALLGSQWQWVALGIFLTATYIVLQGAMYVFSFATVKHRISLADSTLLFIKRNFISVFLPAGGISSLAFYSQAIEKKGIKKSQIHFASSIYGFIGIASVVAIAIPAFLFSVFDGSVGSGEWVALSALVVLVFVMIYLYRSLAKQGWFYKFILRVMPTAEVFLNDLQNSKIDKRQFVLTIVTSLLIDVVGIAHLYVSMAALGFDPSLAAALMGYIVSVVFLIVSPFLRGLGAIELSMSIVLVKFGFDNVQAIAITFLYRFFEFWLPLLAGVLAFMAKLNKLLTRVVPALFLLSLGIINIFSVLTPAVAERLSLLSSFLPIEVIHASNYLVMVAGLFLLVTAAFMLKGLRTAWWFALVLSGLSLIGHLTKAIDFEEATLALAEMVLLVWTRKEYYIKTNPKFRNVGIQTSLLITSAILIYGVVGFYLLDKKHFNIDFSLWQSLQYTLQNYFLVGSDDLVPVGTFANYFLYSINVSGFFSIALLVYTLVVAYRPHSDVSDNELLKAKQLLDDCGRSALDYFKTYSDKMLFFASSQQSFIAYRISGNFAIVLENPVAPNEHEFEACIREFDRYCRQNGLKSIFYRVPEESLHLYHKLGKKPLFLGQEGVVDIASFSLEGSSKRSLRNAVYKTNNQGFKATVHTPPVKDGILQKVKAVSDEWLHDTNRSEIIFSQGMFVWQELKQQTLITVENSEEKIVAFLNIVPDYVTHEATYDLIRKTKDAPNGVMDFILIELFKHLKTLGIQSVNIGFAPMSGLNDPHTFPEKSMKFAYEKIKSFAHYKGLREYKEKFEPVWYNKYLIYQHDYDLLQLPTALAKAIKP